MKAIKRECWIGSKGVAYVYVFDNGAVWMYCNKFPTADDICADGRAKVNLPDKLFPFINKGYKTQHYNYIQSARRWIDNNL